MAECAVAFLLVKLTTILEDKLRKLHGVKEALENVKDELERMTAFLKVADAMEETDMELKVWVKQVRDVAYTIDDFLDQVTLHLANDDAVVCKPFGWIRNKRFHDGIASEINSIKSRLLSIAERHERYRYHFNVAEHGIDEVNSVAHERRGDALLLEEANLVGIKFRKQELMELVVKGGSGLGVVSVVGMGGLGKTTLVKKIFDDSQVKKHFQNHVWITVSQSFKIDQLLKDTIQELFDEIKQSVPQGISAMNGNQLKSVIKQFLRQRRYLLVFDDVWTIHLWELIKYVLPNDNYGSRVIITTRLVDVGMNSSMGTNGHVYHLKPLTQEESWTLFCQKGFRGSSCPAHLMEISHSILRRCGGLPLAIVAIGGVLAAKRTTRFDEWMILEHSLGAELEVNDTLESMKKILLLSYNDLPYYLKACFLYLSIYPEDHLIECNSLVRLWIMEGFVKPRQGRTVEKVAEGYLNELVNRNLIRLIRSNDDGSVKSVRVHDFFREMLLSKARDQSFILTANEQTSAWINNVRRVSIHDSLAKMQFPNSGTQLRSLLAFSVTDPQSVSFMLKLLSSCKMLTVLDLSGSPLETFPKAITKLLHLRYLRLRSTKIKIIPRSINNLQNLETLDLKHSYVSELPGDILKLQKLRHLILYRCKDYSYLPFDFTVGFRPPNGFGVLTSLHQLSFIEANSGSDILEELGKLKELRRLCILKLRMEDGIAACSSIEKLPNLRRLNVSSAEEEEILDLHYIYSPPAFIQRLYMSGRLAKFPQWITSLENLVKIYFRWSRLSDDPLTYLQDLPNLVHLEFLVAYIGEELRFKAGKFQRLKLLDFDKLEPLKRVIVEEGAIPNLEKIIIQRCTFLESVPSGIEHLANMQLLEFFDMPDEFIKNLLPTNVNGDYNKVAHIPQVYYTYWRESGWEAYPLGVEHEIEKSVKSRTAIQTTVQRNSL